MNDLGKNIFDECKYIGICPRDYDEHTCNHGGYYTCPIYICLSQYIRLPFEREGDLEIIVEDDKTEEEWYWKSSSS